MHLYIFEKIKNKAPLKQNEKRHALIYPDLKHLPVEHHSVELNKKKQLLQPIIKRPKNRVVYAPISSL
jgi:hypothetical protein